MRWLPLVNHALSDPLVRYYVKHKAGMATHVPAVLVKCVPHDNKALAPAAACTIRLIASGPARNFVIVSSSTFAVDRSSKKLLRCLALPRLQPPLEEGSDVTG